MGSFLHLAASVFRFLRLAAFVFRFLRLAASVFLFLRLAAFVFRFLSSISKRLVGYISLMYVCAFRISYSEDGYVWTAYNSPLSDAVLGEVLTAESETTNIEFDPPIQVKSTLHRDFFIIKNTG